MGELVSEFEAFPHLSTIHIPPYSPELNPIEQVWSCMRKNKIADLSFNGYEDIVNKGTAAWNDFVRDNKRVIKMCISSWMNMIN